jgi:hypothetical protein
LCHRADQDRWRSCHGDFAEVRLQVRAETSNCRDEVRTAACGRSSALEFITYFGEHEQGGDCPAVGWECSEVIVFLGYGCDYIGRFVMMTRFTVTAAVVRDREVVCAGRCAPVVVSGVEERLPRS